MEDLLMHEAEARSREVSRSVQRHLKFASSPPILDNWKDFYSFVSYIIMGG